MCIGVCGCVWMVYVCGCVDGIFVWMVYICVDGIYLCGWYGRCVCMVGFQNTPPHHTIYIAVFKGIHGW